MVSRVSASLDIFEWSLFPYNELSSVLLVVRSVV